MRRGKASRLGVKKIKRQGSRQGVQMQGRGGWKEWTQRRDKREQTKNVPVRGPRKVVHKLLTCNWRNCVFHREPAQSDEWSVWCRPWSLHRGTLLGGAQIGAPAWIMGG